MVCLLHSGPTGVHNGQKKLQRCFVTSKQTLTSKQKPTQTACNQQQMTFEWFQSKQCRLTMHGKNIAGLSPMARWLSLPTLDEGRQTGSPLVPYKLPRLLPHKGRVPGRSRDSPSWTELLTVQERATRQPEDRLKVESPCPGSVCHCTGECRGSPAYTCDAALCPFCGHSVGSWSFFYCNLVGKRHGRISQQHS